MMERRRFPMNTMQWRVPLLAAALGATLVFAACSKQDQDSARSATNDAVVQTEKKARELGDDAARGMEKAKDATQNMAQQAGDKVNDAVITTGVKAELAKDADLSALQINVDTAEGRVALHGTAPTADARARATTLAQSVKGVVAVDNSLTVESRKP
jgi:hypothetical protein